MKKGILALFSAAILVPMCGTAQEPATRTGRRRPRSSSWPWARSRSRARFRCSQARLRQRLHRVITIDEEKVNLTYGLGLQYDATRNIGIRAQWQRYDTTEEIHLFSLGVIWRF